MVIVEIITKEMRTTEVVKYELLCSFVSTMVQMYLLFFVSKSFFNVLHNFYEFRKIRP